MNHELIKAVSSLTDLSLPDDSSREQAELLLAQFINDLILHDFSRLIGLLYRVDVSENRLKDLLTTHSETDAGLIIARMIIERQEEKLKSRQNYKSEFPNDGEERW